MKNRCAPALILLLLMVSGVATAAGADAPIRISQYAHTAWRPREGGFNGIPFAIAQTADGYLWIGTSQGLIRFDGSRLVPWTPPSAPPGVFADGIFSLAATRDGSLWIGSSTLMQWSGTRLTGFATTGRINAILEDPAGGVWIARSRARDEEGPLCHTAGQTLTCFGKADGISLPHAGFLFRDRNGALWLAGSGGLATGTPGSFRTYVPSFVKASLETASVGAVAQAAEGTMLIGMVQSGPHRGLQQLKEGRWAPFRRPDLDGDSLKVSTMLTVRDGALWIGTFDAGLFVVRDHGVDHFSSLDGLSGDAVNAIHEDREGNIWVITSAGMDRFRAPRVTTFSRREGLSSDTAMSVLAARDGSVYVGNHDTLDQIRDGVIASVPGLPRGRVTVLLEDQAGRLWAGVDNALLVREAGRFRRLSRSDGAPVGTLQKLVEDRSGDLWGVPVPSGARLVHVHGDIVQDVALGPMGSAIFSVAPDPDGGLWLGFRDGAIARYRQGGLTRISATGEGQVSGLLAMSGDRLLTLISGHVYGWRGGRLQRLWAGNGLPCSSVYDLLRDRQGGLWLYAPCGLIAIDSDALQRWWDNPGARVSHRLFDNFDGAQPDRTPFSPAASEGPDGRLWLVNGAVVQMIDPRRIAVNTLVPPVHIESVVADGRPYPLQSSVTLPALTRDLEIAYTGLSYVVPEKVRFRYRLEGRDTGWQDPGGRRQAFYTDMPPGRYRFRVMASNNDGLWNTAGASQELVILPAFYQTGWFKAVLALAGALLIWAAHAVRMRIVADQLTARLSERLQERERIARELHDTLLQDFQAVILLLQSVSRRLSAGDPNRQALEEGLDHADKVLAEGRDRIQDIRADTQRVDELSDALARQGEALARTHDIAFALTTAGPQPMLDPLVRDEVHRIGREAIGNAFRHSHGSRITVHIEYRPDRLLMIIQDDGEGMDPDVLQNGRPGHWGIPGMHERARKIGARLELSSHPGAGTRLTLDLPVRPSGARRPWWRRWKRGATAHEADVSR